jgi:hypothetical protein
VSIPRTYTRGIYPETRTVYTVPRSRGATLVLLWGTILLGMLCPICRREVQREANRTFPFCSRRCKLIDLGKWLGEEYRIAGPAAPEPKARASDAEDDKDRLIH